MPRSRAKKSGLKRTVVVRVEMSKQVHETLLSVANILAMAYNELNYKRRKLFFDKQLTPQKMNETYSEVYKKYSEAYRIKGGKQTLFGSDTLQAVLNLSDDNWRAFFRLLKAKKKGKLANWLKVNPPGYSKKGKRRVPFIRLKARQWELKKDKLIVRGVPILGNRIELKIKGRVHWKGKKGELMLRYNVDKKEWYAYIQLYGDERQYKDEWKSVPLPFPGSGIAGVDLGINNLFAVYAIRPDGSYASALFSGRPLKAIWFYWKRRIAKYQSLLAGYDLRTSRKLRVMHRKAKLQMKNYIDHNIREMLRWLRRNGVGIVVVGFPHDIVHSKGTEYTVRVWMYGYITRRLKKAAEEEGIQLYFVSEEYTSTTDPFSGNACKTCRRKRGLFYSPTIGKVLNADLVGAFNILRKFLHNPESLGRGIGVMGPRPGPGLNETDVAPNLPALAGTSTFRAGRRSGQFHHG